MIEKKEKILNTIVELNMTNVDLAKLTLKLKKKFYNLSTFTDLDSEVEDAVEHAVSKALYSDFKIDYDKGSVKEQLSSYIYIIAQNTLKSTYKKYKKDSTIAVEETTEDPVGSAEDVCLKKEETKDVPLRIREVINHILNQLLKLRNSSYFEIIVKYALGKDKSNNMYKMKHELMSKLQINGKPITVEQFDAIIKAIKHSEMITKFSTYTIFKFTRLSHFGEVLKRLKKWNEEHEEDQLSDYYAEHDFIQEIKQQENDRKVEAEIKAFDAWVASEDRDITIEYDETGNVIKVSTKLKDKPSVDITDLYFQFIEQEENLVATDSTKPAETWKEFTDRIAAQRQQEQEMLEREAAAFLILISLILELCHQLELIYTNMFKKLCNTLINITNFPKELPILRI